MALGNAPREHTTFGPEHCVAGGLVEGVAEGWAIPLSMWSVVNCTVLGACVWCACVLCDKSPRPMPMPPPSDCFTKSHTNCPFLPTFLSVTLCVSCEILQHALLSQNWTIAMPERR